MLVAIGYYCVGKEVEGGLKVNEDEIGDLCERFSCN